MSRVDGSALVTGAASGLGAAAAGRLEAEGLHVVRLDLAQTSGVVRGDVTEAADVQRAIELARRLRPRAVA